MGCNSSKDGHQPKSNNKPTASQSSQPPQGNRSPAKPQHMNIKSVKEDELKKHQDVDILQFIKLGRLDMVHGLITHYNLGLQVMNLRGLQDDFMFNTEKMSTVEWNPLLLAVAFKRSDIVRYLIDELHVSLINLGRVPFSNNFWSEEQYSDETFCVKLAIANKDAAMLTELWNSFQAWDYPHLDHVVKYLVQVKWTEGLAAILRHKSSEIIFKSQSEFVQADLVRKWMELRIGQPSEITQCLDAELSSKPYSLISIYVLLEESSNSSLDQQESLTFLQGAIPNVSALEYGYLKYSPKASNLSHGIDAFARKGDDESSAMKKLREHFEKLDGELDSHQYFGSPDKFEDLKQQVLTMIQRGQSEQFQSFVELVDLRRLFHFDGNNYNSASTQLNSNQYALWTPIHHMIFSSPSEAKSLDMLKELVKLGFHLKSCLRMIQSVDAIFASQDPMAFGAVLEIAIEKQRPQLLTELLSDDYVDVWTRNNLYYIREGLKEFNCRHYSQLILESHACKNIFLSLSMSDQDAFIKDWVTTSQAQVNEMFSKPPYVLVALPRMIERDNFIKMRDFSLFQRCIDAVSQSELEGLSKVPGNDEKFLQFLRFNMLNEGDERRVNGQKLIERIYELPSFKAYKNQSLAILDHESLIQEEEDVEQAIQQIHVNNVDLAQMGDSKKQVRFQ